MKTSLPSFAPPRRCSRAFHPFLRPAQPALSAMRARPDGPGPRRPALRGGGREDPGRHQGADQRRRRPAMGGVIVGHEMARALGVPGMFLERPEGTFHLRRGFRLEQGQKVLMMEDVVTTGLSSREAIAAIARERGARRSRPPRWSTLERHGRSGRALLPADPTGRAELRPDEPAARTGGDPRDQAGEPRGGMTEHLRLASISTMSRPCGMRAARAIPIRSRRR